MTPQPPTDPANERKTVVWDPNGSNRFMVAGSSELKLYEWNAGKGEMRHIVTKSKLSGMQAFAWSPHPDFEDLVAVALASGRVDLIRLGQPVHSPTESLAAFQPPPFVSLPVRHKRHCTTLDFSNINPNLLALGLERFRNDATLMIWDVETSIPVFAPPTSHGNNRGLDATPSPHFKRLSLSQENRIIHQYGASEGVSSICFHPSSSTMVLAGMNGRWLRAYDLRAAAYNSAQPLAVSTRAVYGICCDHFDLYRLASYHENTIRLWDQRKFTEPLLSWSEMDAAADGASKNTELDVLEFSGFRRGLVASHVKDQHYVRLWSILDGSAPVDGAIPQNDGVTTLEAPPARVPSRMRWPSPANVLSWGSPSEEVVTSPPASTPSRVYLYNTQRSKSMPKPVSGFAFVPHPPASTSIPHIITVNKEGDLAITIKRDSPRHTWSCSGDLIASVGKSYKIYRAEADSAVIGDPWDIPIQDQLPFKFREDGREGRPSRRFARDRDGPEGSGLGIRNLNLKGRTFSPSSLKQFPFEKPSTPQLGPAGLSPEMDNAMTPQFAKSGDVTPIISPTPGPSGYRSSRRAMSEPRTSERLIQQDISIIMRRRAIAGYGLQSMTHNSAVTQESDKSTEFLPELWAWLHNSQQILNADPSNVHYFDFNFQGLLAIWEGAIPRVPIPSTKEEDSPGTIPPSYPGGRSRQSSTVSLGPPPQAETRLESYTTALAAMNSRQTHLRGTRLPTLPKTDKAGERLLSLSLCGWDQSDDNLFKRISRMDKEGEYAHAACWAVFIGDYDMAIEYLLHSKDERHRIMSATLAALTAQLKTDEPKTPEWTKHYEQVAARLEEPYLRLMLQCVLSRDYWELAQEESIPLRERLAIAYRFLSDAEVTKYLKERAHRLNEKGDIEGLLLSGMTATRYNLRIPSGMDVLANYLDATGDVQSAAILAALIPRSSSREDGSADMRIERWVAAYQDLLDGWKLFHFRCQFDIERGRILQAMIDSKKLQPFEWVPRQLAIRCQVCKKVINAQQPTGASGVERLKVNACPNCQKKLPRCSICLLHIGIPDDTSRNAELEQQTSMKDTMDESLVFCQSCRHGGHASHILAWFFGVDNSSNAHDVCPVADCDCRCLDEQAGGRP